MTVAVFGEALIDLVGGDDGGYRAHLGGSPYNFAIALARQGVDVSFLAPFSDDSFGERLRASLEHEGVATPIARRSRLPTSIALVTVGPGGVPSYRLYRQAVADTDVDFDELAAHVPSGLTLFHTGSLALAPEQIEKVTKLVAWLRGRGALISIDLNVRLAAVLDTEAYVEGVRSLLPLADVVKASDDDLAALGLGAEEAYERMGRGLLVETRGGDGAVLHTAEGTIARPAYPVAVIADTIGAGDVFHAAFVAKLLGTGALPRPLCRIERGALEAALDFACAAAAINVSRAGCSPPSREEVEAFLEARGG